MNQKKKLLNNLFKDNTFLKQILEEILEEEINIQNIFIFNRNNIIDANINNQNYHILLKINLKKYHEEKDYEDIFTYYNYMHKKNIYIRQINLNWSYLGKDFKEVYSLENDDKFKIIEINMDILRKNKDLKYPNLLRIA